MNIPNRSIVIPTSNNTFGILNNCPIRISPIFSSFDAFVTRIPVESEIIIDGIWDTRPSPIVRIVYLLIASEKLSPCCVMPIIRPPTILIRVIIRPAVASPLTYFDAPSMAPKNADSCWILSLLRIASLSSMAPDERSASIAICFPGIASNVNRAVTSDTRSEPLLITIIWTMINTIKTIAPMTRFPPPTNEPNT